MKTLLTILAAVATMQGAAQDSVNIRFNFLANGKPLVLKDSVYTNSAGEKYSVTKLKFYVGKIHFTGRSGLNSEYYLIDAAKAFSFNVAKPDTGILDKLIFHFGVSKELNEAGALDGALDPMNGMYWAWNSGYINLKFEGISPSSTAAGNRFEHHLGGYRDSEASSLEVALPLLRINASELKSILITVDLDKYGKAAPELLFAPKPIIGVPGASAVSLMKIAAHMFIASPCCYLL